MKGETIYLKKKKKKKKEKERKRKLFSDDPDYFAL